MATLLAPYNTAMQLGSGFNSFTQQLCIDHAVISDPELVTVTEKQLPDKQVAQEVVYKASIVDKVTDVTNAMNINAAFNIKNDSFDAKGKANFINTSKVKESDVSFMFSVKVVNQVIHDHSLTRFQPVQGLKAQNMTDVYGDCFISGFQEGGEFTAVISVKAKDRESVEDLKIQAAVQFTKDKLTGNVEGDFKKESTDFLKENETTISVTWTGGGQDLKQPEEDWTFETMKAAALKFPKLVSQTPMRTHAILTKYSALRSFQAMNLQFTLPSFEYAGVYTSLLQEAYLDYKTIAKNLQVLAFDVSSGLLSLQPAPSTSRVKESSSLEGVSADSSDKQDGSDSVDSLSSVSPAGKPISNVTITDPYPPTVQGVEAARVVVRFMLNRIVREVDLIARSPELAIDEGRQLPYMSPLLFKQLLPIGQPVGKTETPAVDNAATPADPNNLQQQLSGQTRAFF